MISCLVCGTPVYFMGLRGHPETVTFLLECTSCHSRFSVTVKLEWRSGMTAEDIAARRNLNH